jgi:glycosyltransferase domain-containing protein
MSGNLGKLTVCIFTFNRPKELLRLIKFWSNYDVKILVMDASPKDLKLNKTSHLTYFHVPQLTLQQRLIKFSENIETEYMLLSPDDDFFFPKGLNETLMFLESNKDFSSAQGLRIRFYDFPAFNWLPDYLAQINLKFVNENKDERLIEMHRSMHYIYSIIRSGDFCKITDCLQGVSSNKKDSQNINEYIFNYTLPVLGKHLILPVLYSARKAHPYYGADNQFYKWVNDPSDKEAQALRANMIRFYVNEINCSPEKAAEYFELLTLSFSIQKDRQIPKERKIVKQIRKLFFESRLRFPYFLTKIKYFYFFWILASNKKLFLSVGEIRTLRNYLKHNQLL